VIVVPALILLFGLDARQAVGTSLVMIVFTALSATVAYYRQKRIDWKIGIAAATTTVPGAAVGAYATKLFTSKVLTIIFGVTLLFIAAGMLRRSFGRQKSTENRGVAGSKGDTGVSRRVWKRKLTDSAGQVFEFDAKIYSGIVFLFVGGLASGFLGIGGGLIVVPILAALVGMPMHLAVATSMLTMIFTSISGVSTHIILGNVLAEFAVPLVIGIVIGAQLGARTARRLRSASLERVFAAAVLGIGILLIVARL